MSSGEQQRSVSGVPRPSRGLGPRGWAGGLALVVILAASWSGHDGVAARPAHVADSAAVLAARVAAAEPADPPAMPYPPPQASPAAPGAEPVVPDAEPNPPAAPYPAPPAVPYPAPYPPAPFPPPAPPPAAPPAVPPSPSALLTVWLTGYSWLDNNPPGSSKVSHPILHGMAGGEGTYEDPITAAVAGGGGGIWTPGARFYVSSLARYVIVEDTGASGTSSGDDGHLDVWIDGRDGSREATDACMARFTAHRVPVYYNPPPGLPVISGPIFANGRCNIPGERPVTRPTPFPLARSG